jgi:hypothetical protein
MRYAEITEAKRLKLSFTFGTRETAMVWQNPTHSELLALANRLHLLRGLTNQSNLFVWDARTYPHGAINSALENEGIVERNDHLRAIVLVLKGYGFQTFDYWDETDVHTASGIDMMTNAGDAVWSFPPLLRALGRTKPPGPRLNETAIRIPNPSVNRINQEQPMLTVLKNPSKAELVKLLDEVEDEVRGFIVPEACYFWDGYHALHGATAQALGYESVVADISIIKRWSGKPHIIFKPPHKRDKALANPYLKRALEGMSVPRQ